MFEAITDAMRSRMRELEELDLRDRNDGTPHFNRLRQIPAEVGKFLAITAAQTPPGDFIEIGTSAGYSTLWLSLAARATGRKIITFEISPEKVALARQTFARCGVDDVVNLIHGDARDHLKTPRNIAFCFLDAEKDVYGPCYELLVPQLARGGLIVADNVINLENLLRPMIDRALTDQRVDAVIVPFDNGELVCRKK